MSSVILLIVSKRHLPSVRVLRALQRMEWWAASNQNVEVRPAAFMSISRHPFYKTSHLTSAKPRYLPDVLDNEKDYSMDSSATCRTNGKRCLQEDIPDINSEVCMNIQED